MKNKILFTIPFFLFLIFYVYTLSKRTSLLSDRDFYYHWHLAKFKVKEKLTPQHKLFIFKDGKIVNGIGRRKWYDFKIKDGISVAKFPIPWNAPSGIYKAQIYHPSQREREKFLPRFFYIKRRIPKEVKFPFNAINWENTKPMQKVRIPLPDGKKTDGKGIYEWLKILKVDTLLYLAGQTAYFGRSLPFDFPWIENNLKFLGKIVDETKKRKFRIGAWVVCYFCVGKRDENLGYKWAIDYDVKNDRMKKTRGISIGDRKRIRDIIKVLKQMDSFNLDFLGLDYIRPVQGGYELVDEFRDEMDVIFPAHLKTKKERMLYLARQIHKERNFALEDLWNWWRAHRVSQIIVEIKENLNTSKPLWAFVLSWAVGHQHGQDPAMFQDAGIDFFTVMLYECDSEQFEKILKQWKNYGVDKFNLIVGNQIDYNVHQFVEDTPQEFARRIREAKKVFKAKGIFVNDFSRAFWGRKGDYSAFEWLISIHPEVVKK